MDVVIALLVIIAGITMIVSEILDYKNIDNKLSTTAVFILAIAILLKLNILTEMHNK